VQQQQQLHQRSVGEGLISQLRLQRRCSILPAACALPPVLQVPLPNGKTLDIVTNNNSAANVYVQGVTWNGAPVTGTTVSYFDIMAGGTLQFTMGPSPASAREAKKAPRAAGPRLRSNARA